jgi:tetratricopeptide (TPR) repeat protein
MDKTLRVWETISGEQRASIPLLGALNTIALHPTQPYAICGDDGGNLYLLDLFGLAYGPISVSATHDGMGYTLRCPACQREQPIQAEQLGSDMDCADETCGLSLHINQFYVEKEVQFGIAYLEKEYNELIVEWKGEKALETIEKILEVEPHNRKYQIEHVCLLLALRRMEDAEAALMHLKTIGIQPKGEDIGRIYFLKGAVTLRLKEQTQLIQKEALEALELSLQSMPISRTWFYRASILDILDNREAALKSYMEARRLEKEESTSQNPAVSHDTWKTGLYRFYFGENERDEIDVEIGWLYIKMNNFAKAKAELQAMIKRGVEDPMAVYGLGLALIGLKQFQEACPYFKRFLQIARQEHQSFISSAKDIIGKICTDVD